MKYTDEWLESARGELRRRLVPVQYEIANQLDTVETAIESLSVRIDKHEKALRALQRRIRSVEPAKN